MASLGAKAVNRRARRINLLNAGAAVAALSVSFGLALLSPPAAQRNRGIATVVAHDVRVAATTPRRKAGGTLVLADAGGREIPLRHYKRIVSGSTIADQLLLELCEPSRIAAFTTFSRHAPRGYRFSGKPTIGFSRNIEKLMALLPDLVLVNNFMHPGLATRLGQSGVEVFDLGPMHGTLTLIPNILAIGQLVGRPEQAKKLARSFVSRARAIARGLDPRKRKRAMYLSIIGGKLVGGTRGTSFQDVLAYAGLIDVAAAHYSGWPRYTAEQVLSLAPSVIVTQDEMARQVCQTAGLQRLPACQQPKSGILALPRVLLQDAGLGILDAAERLHRLAYPHAP